MKLPWSLILLAISLLIVSKGALGYVSSQLTPTVEIPSASIVSSPLPTIVSLGRLEPESRVIHVTAPFQNGQSRVEILLVSQGKNVKRKQVLAILDGKSEHEAKLEQSKKELMVALAELERTKAAPRRNEQEAQEAVIARLEAELDNATKEQERYLGLYAQGAVSASVKDAKSLTVNVCQQQLNQAQANLSLMSEIRPADVDVASAHVESARAAINLAQSQLDLDYVRAPIDGQILKINCYAGETAGERGICDMAETQHMYAIAEVYESDASRIKLGQAALIKCDALPEAVHGKVREIGLQIERKQTLDADAAADVDSRIVEVRIKIDDKDCIRVARYTNSHVKVLIQTETQKK